MIQRKIVALSITSILALPLFLLQSCTKSTTSATLSGDWIRSGDFDGVGRSDAVSATLNDKVYAGLGFDGTTRLTDFWEFDAVNDEWRRKKDFPGVPRNAAVAFSANNKVYVGLGYDGTTKLKDFWEYDPATDTWKQIADFGGSARYGANGFSLKNKGYVVGGYDGNPSKELWQYDPLTDIWTLKNEPGSKRYNASVFVIDDKAYLVTGTNNGTNVNDFWMYDPDVDKWTEKRKISNVSTDTYDDSYNIIRYSGTAFVINGKGYITTGVNGGYTTTTWEYDPATDLWTAKTGFQGSAREGAIGFTINNRGYVAMGRNSTSLYFDDVREFLPNNASDTNND